MTQATKPDPNTIFPVPDIKTVTYITIKNPNIIVGDGAITGANSVVGRDVEPYTIAVGNPAKIVRKRFDDRLTALMLKFKWWDRSIDEVNELIPILSNSDLKKVTEEL